MYLSTRMNEIGLSNRRCGREVFKPIIIGRGSVLTNRVIVVAGAKIGDGCIIGAGTVIDCEIPDNSLVSQVEARSVKLPADGMRIG